MPFSQYRSITVEPGLYLVEPKGGRTYQARARVDGSWKHTGTETADYHAAEKFARKWFRQIQAGRDGHETIAQAATEYLKSISDSDKRAYHSMKWEAIREFWNPGMGKPSVIVAAIDTPKLLEFVQWRRVRGTLGRSSNPTITASTLHKDLVTLRQILKYAVARGVVPSVPHFPGAHVIGSIETNPQPWLTKDEWARLLMVAQQRVKEASNVRTQGQRHELLVFLHFMHSTGMRVDEARAIRACDCIAKYTAPASADTLKRRSKQAQKKYAAKSFVAIDVQMRYLEINVRTSKTGHRVTFSRKPIPSLVMDWIGSRPADAALFREHHRDAFRELLIAANLRNTRYGPRNAKCLRPTAISHWLIDKPTIPLSWLAANCGTSIQMLQDFYIKRLGLALDGSAWL